MITISKQEIINHTSFNIRLSPISILIKINQDNIEIKIPLELMSPLPWKTCRKVIRIFLNTFQKLNLEVESMELATQRVAQTSGINQELQITSRVISQTNNDILIYIIQLLIEYCRQ